MPAVRHGDRTGPIVESASPAAEALRALFCFHIARTPARSAEDGSLVLLHEQDRTRWDATLLEEGFVWLARSARGTEYSRFHLEAGIAGCHAKATSYATTDWSEIVALYDLLRDGYASPIVDVSRALAVAMRQGARAGLDELDSIPERELIERYPYALAMYAELHASLGELDEARAFLDRAIDQQTSSAEHALLSRKRAALGQTALASDVDRPALRSFLGQEDSDVLRDGSLSKQGRKRVRF